ncbi:hypothetical protein SDC9_187605 [bioreactor metagenome]|uniref:Uncharacterized protein n=1 Tax=bioreactor metagenome TaxID=1076179 RepID=A0A645HMM3_9ZZZZ
MDKMHNNIIDATDHNSDVIDDTYNGAKYPIIEREFNAYYFPDNYNPDTLKSQLDGGEIKIYTHGNPQ